MPAPLIWLSRSFLKLLKTRFSVNNSPAKNSAQLQRALDIETALERVRSRTMAMHRSNELHEVSELLYAELKTLVDFSDFTSCGYIEVDEENHVQHAWMTRPDGTSIGDHGLPLKGDPVMSPGKVRGVHLLLNFDYSAGVNF